MKPRPIARDIYQVGAVDPDRRLFDELIPLPDGTSYNAYLVRGLEKTCLVDTVDPPFTAELVANLRALSRELGFTRLDYVIAHHLEQDHAGAIPEILRLHPEAKLVVTPKGRELAIDHLHVAEDRFQVVADGETIDLGGRTLEFLHAPWVHWPETMLTYLREERILFPCDLFGSHVGGTALYASGHEGVLDAAKRYYAEIMMPFAGLVRKHLDRLAGYDLRLVAPSHGPIWDDPRVITSAYRRWVDDPPRNLVLIPWISMHGSTKVMVERLTDALLAEGLEVAPFNLSDGDLGRLAMLLVDAATVVVATGTVLTGAHPKAISAVYLANALRPKAKVLGIIGSYGWGGRTVEQLKSLAPNLKVELLEPLLVKGLPREADLAALDALAGTIAAKHRELGIAPAAR